MTRRRNVRAATVDDLMKNRSTASKPANSLRSDKPIFQKQNKALTKTKAAKKDTVKKALGLSPSEDAIQITIMSWAKLQKWKKGCIADYLHHSPNGGKRHISTAVKFKQMGVKAGFPDLFLPIAAGPFHGLFIELKAANGKVSVVQAEYHPLLIDEGYRVEVCYTPEGAINLMKNYLGLSNSP